MPVSKLEYLGSSAVADHGTLQIHSLRKLDIPWQKKAGVCSVFVMGFVVTVTSVVRLQYLVRLGFKDVCGSRRPSFLTHLVYTYNTDNFPECNLEPAVRFHVERH